MQRSADRATEHRPSPRFAPRPDQKDAVGAVASLFTAGEARSQLIAPPGAGKTVMALWVTERLGASTVLYFAPSLSLVSQSATGWFGQFDPAVPLDAICVCSDETVGEDIPTSDVPLPVTTDPDVLAEFLSRPNAAPHARRIVFATYQSVYAVEAGLALAGYRRGAREIDLAVCDEAHRIAGPEGKRFQIVLDADRVPARRRLFMTATPRVLAPHQRRVTADGEALVASMDDTERFGPVAYRLSYGDAITLGLLADYQIDVLVVRDREVRTQLRDGDDDLTALAQATATVNALERGTFHHAFSFHHTKVAARRFLDAFRHIAGAARAGAWISDAVFGEMPVAGRRAALSAMLGAERGLLANVRALAEGIDAPALDAIVFVDPKRSVVDIAQVVGRALRRGPALADKKAHIVVPLVLSGEASAEAELMSSEWEPVWRLVAAMAANDERLERELALAVHQTAWRDAGRVPKVEADVEALLARSLVLSLPPDLPLARLVRAVTVRAVQEVGNAWEYGFGRLTAYVDRAGTAAVSAGLVEPEGYTLGRWATDQRAAFRAGRLAAERAARLEKLPSWSWGRGDAEWTQGWRALRRFVRRHGHARVPVVYWDAWGFWLSEWVDDARARQASVPPLRRAALEALPGWTWRRAPAATRRCSGWAGDAFDAEVLAVLANPPADLRGPALEVPTEIAGHAFVPPRKRRWEDEDAVHPAVDWVVRTVLPAWMRHVGLTREAGRLERQPPITHCAYRYRNLDLLEPTVRAANELLRADLQAAYLLTEWSTLGRDEFQEGTAVGEAVDRAARAAVYEQLTLHDAEPGRRIADDARRVLVACLKIVAARGFRRRHRPSVPEIALQRIAAQARRRTGDDDIAPDMLYARSIGRSVLLRRFGVDDLGEARDVVRRLARAQRRVAGARLPRRVRERAGDAAGWHREVGSEVIDRDLQYLSPTERRSRKWDRLGARDRMRVWLKSERDTVQERVVANCDGFKKLGRSTARTAIRRSPQPEFVLSVERTFERERYTRAKAVSVWHGIVLAVPKHASLTIRRAETLVIATEHAREHLRAQVQLAREADAAMALSPAVAARILGAPTKLPTRVLSGIDLIAAAPISAHDSPPFAYRPYAAVWLRALADRSVALESGVLDVENGAVVRVRGVTASTASAAAVDRAEGASRGKDGSLGCSIRPGAVPWPPFAYPDWREPPGMPPDLAGDGVLPDVVPAAGAERVPTAVRRGSGSPGYSVMPNGMVVESRDERFELNVAAIRQFAAAQGHLLPSKKDRPNDINIYVFLQRMERAWRTNALPVERRAVLDAIPEWHARLRRPQASGPTPDAVAANRSLDLAVVRSDARRTARGEAGSRHHRREGGASADDRTPEGPARGHERESGHATASDEIAQSLANIAAWKRTWKARQEAQRRQRAERASQRRAEDQANSPRSIPPDGREET
jgi:superfamily II DNA or RNA helicase